VLASSPRLLAGRNLTLGKPGHYVKQDGRLVAVGGTRTKTSSAVKIVKVPAFERDTDRMPLFALDEEMAEFAVSAVRRPAAGLRVDIRERKRVQAQEREAVAGRVAGGRTLIDRMLIKLDWNRSQEAELGPATVFGSHMAEFQEAKTAKGATKIDITKESDDGSGGYKSFNVGKMDYQEDLDKVTEPKTVEPEEPIDALEDEFSKSDEEVAAAEPSNAAAMLVVKNSWASTPKNVVPDDLDMDECPPLRGYHATSIKPSAPRTPVLNFEGYTGLDTCDVTVCFCKEATAGKDGRAGTAQEFETPMTSSHSGSQTPSGPRKGSQRIAKDLLRVKRALKTLGVKIIEFDDHEGSGESKSVDYLDKANLILLRLHQGLLQVRVHLRQPADQADAAVPLREGGLHVHLLLQQGGAQVL
jgi:hypothetical protein